MNKKNINRKQLKEVKWRMSTIKAIKNSTTLTLIKFKQGSFNPISQLRREKTTNKKHKIMKNRTKRK